MSTVLVTGASGFLGQHVVEALLQGGHEVDRLRGSKRVDLRRRTNVDFSGMEGTDVVVHLAYPGSKGIQTSVETAADLVHDQLLIDLNVIDGVARQPVKKLITVGSVCEYPENVTFPTGEDQLWSGYPEAVNAPYGIAKRMQQGLLEAYRRQYGLQSTQLILGNLYGPGDRSGHVIPSLIRRATAAATSGDPLIVWGDGTATREFLYVEDAAEAIVKAVEAPPQVEPINVVSGQEVSIAALADMIAAHCGISTTKIKWDATKPNGQPRRHFSNRRAKAVLGWRPHTNFASGLATTVKWLRGEERL